MRHWSWSLNPPSAQVCLHGHIRFFVKPPGTALLQMWEWEGRTGTAKQEKMAQQRLAVATVENAGLQHKLQELQMLKKSETHHTRPPFLQGTFGNIHGKRCAAMAVHNWDSNSRAPIFGGDTWCRKISPTSSKRHMDIREMPEGIFCPGTFLPTEEPWRTQSPSTTHHVWRKIKTSPLSL